MNNTQLNIMHSGKGFIAALDQSGGSTPKALKLYGIDESAYKNDQEMFDLVHQMRTRIITSPAFSSDYILGAILFEMTMDRKIEDYYTADYLWDKKGIVPFLKVDKGLAELQNGVQLMKPMPDLEVLLERANERNIFGTKMRSVIKNADAAGIKAVVEQQFEMAMKIVDAGLVPIIEPETDITSAEREEAENILLEEIENSLKFVGEDVKLMLKVSIPVVDNLYEGLMQDPRIVRIVALSGGFSRQEANMKLAHNHGLIASFSRALTEGLSVNQSDEEFNEVLAESVKGIYEASIT